MFQLLWRKFAESVRFMGLIQSFIQVVGFWCWWSRILSNVDVVSDSCYWSELCHPSQDGTMEHVSATATTNTQPIETVWLQSWPQYSTPLCLQWEGIEENQSRSGDIFLTRFPSLSISLYGTKRSWNERFNVCLSLLILLSPNSAEFNKLKHAKTYTRWCNFQHL